MDTSSVLKSLGVSATVIAVAVIIGGSLYVYKSVLETRLIQLNIDKLKREKAAI